MSIISHSQAENLLDDLHEARGDAKFLRHEIGRAALILDEGAPLEMLAEMADRMTLRTDYEDAARLRALMATIRSALEILEDA